jgi:hypothetical protein
MNVHSVNSLAGISALIKMSWNKENQSTVAVLRLPSCDLILFQTCVLLSSSDSHDDGCSTHLWNVGLLNETTPRYIFILAAVRTWNLTSLHSVSFNFISVLYYHIRLDLLSFLFCWSFRNLILYVLLTCHEPCMYWISEPAWHDRSNNMLSVLVYYKSPVLTLVSVFSVLQAGNDWQTYLSVPLSGK